MLSISKYTDKQKKRIRTLRRISLPKSPLLTDLVGSSHLHPSKYLLFTQKKTRTTKKIFDMDEDGEKAKTLL